MNEFNLSKRTDGINKADKDSTIVIMNRFKYVDKGNKHLSKKGTNQDNSHTNGHNESICGQWRALHFIYCVKTM